MFCLSRELTEAPHMQSAALHTGLLARMPAHGHAGPGVQLLMATL